MIGCDIANTPTSKVEDYLGKYQRLDDDISLSYVQLSFEEDISDKYIEKYQKLIEKQYKSLSYEIKDEEIDGDNANVTVQIKVYDYSEILNKYYEDDFIDDEYHKTIINELENQKDKVIYTVVFELKLDKQDTWKVQELSLDDQRKLLGIN